MACKFKTLFPETWLKKEVERWGDVLKRESVHEGDRIKEGFSLLSKWGRPNMDDGLRERANRGPR